MVRAAGAQKRKNRIPSPLAPLAPASACKRCCRRASGRLRCAPTCRVAEWQTRRIQNPLSLDVSVESDLGSRGETSIFSLAHPRARFDHARFRPRPQKSESSPTAEVSSGLRTTLPNGATREPTRLTDRIAVVVNGRARQVRPTSSKFSTRSCRARPVRLARPGRGRPHAHNHRRAAHRTVLTGGGDGTFVQMVTRVVRAAAATGSASASIWPAQAGHGQRAVMGAGSDPTSSNKPWWPTWRVCAAREAAARCGSRGRRHADPICGLGRRRICLEHYGTTKEWLSRSGSRAPSRRARAPTCCPPWRAVCPSFCCDRARAYASQRRGALCAYGQRRQARRRARNGSRALRGPVPLGGLSTIPYWALARASFRLPRSATTASATRRRRRFDRGGDTHPQHLAR